MMGPKSYSDSRERRARVCGVFVDALGTSHADFGGRSTLPARDNFVRVDEAIEVGDLLLLVVGRRRR